MSQDGSYGDAHAREVSGTGKCPVCEGGNIRYGCFAVLTILGVAVILVIVGVSFSLTDISVLGAVIGVGGLVATAIFIRCHFECCTKRDGHVSVSEAPRSGKEEVKYARRVPSAQPVTLTAFLAMKTQKVGSSADHPGRSDDDIEGTNRGHGGLAPSSLHQDKDSAPVGEILRGEEDRAKVILVAHGDPVPDAAPRQQTSDQNTENSVTLPSHGHIVEDSEHYRHSSIDTPGENGTKIVFSFQNGLPQTFHCS